MHTIVVQVRNITLSAEERLIEKARALAQQRATTLNQLFREWLKNITRQPGNGDSYDRLMERLGHRRSGRKLTREQLNER